MGSSFLRLIGVLFSLSTAASAGPLDDLLNEAINPAQGGRNLLAGLCDKNPAIRAIANSIDGVSIYGGATFKGFANFGCERTIWKGSDENRNDSKKARIQDFCIAGVSGSTSKPMPLNGSVSIMFGCKGDVDAYKGYFLSGGVSGARVNLGMDEGFFEDTAVFLGLAKRASGSGGENFEQMVARFSKAREQILEANAKLRANPAAKAALRSLRAEVQTADHATRDLSAVLGDILDGSNAFLNGTNEIIHDLTDIRTRIRSVEAMSKGEAKTLATREVVQRAIVLQAALDQLRLDFSPNVMALSTVTNLDGTQFKNEIKGAFHYGGVPQASKAELEEYFQKGGFDRQPLAFPPSFPRLEDIILSPKGERIGSVHSGLPPQGGRRSMPFANNRTLTTILAGGGTTPPQGSTTVSYDDLRKATNDYERVAFQAIQGVEAARNFSILTGDSAIDLNRTGKANLDRQVGSAQRSPYFSGCNSISLPIEGLVRDGGRALPALLEAAISFADSKGAATSLATRSRDIPRNLAAATSDLKAKGGDILSNRRPYAEAGGGVSFYRKAGDTQTINTPAAVERLLDGLRDCAKAGPAKAGADPFNNDSYAHSGGGGGGSRPSSDESDAHF